MSDAPRRLLEDPELSDELRAGLEAARDELPPYDAGAGLERLQREIGPDGGGPAPDADPSATTAGWSGAAKAAVVAGAAAVVTAGALLLSSSGEPEPARLPASAAPPAEAARSANAAASARQPEREEAPAPEPSAAPAPSAREPEEEPAEKTAPAATSAGAKAAASSDRQATLAEEVRHLAKVRQLLGSNPAAAARAADEGHRRFARGVLYQEREALAIRALARSGNASAARTRGKRFLSAFPTSPYADQVRAATKLP